jgi:penicillin-binding protein 2
MASVTHFHDEQHGRNAKSLHLVIGVATLFFVLVVRLAYLQILQAELNIRLSKENSMRLRIMTPTRGCIYDRNGEMLARNRPSYSICVLPSQLKRRKSVISALCRIRDSLGAPVFDSTDLDAVIKNAYARKFDPTRLKEDASFDLISIVEEHAMELPGIIVVAESRREYPLGSETFHALGYMTDIPETDFDSLRQHGYNYGDLIGKAGLERQYEKDMRGTCGQEYIEVDAHGKNLGAMPNTPRIAPVPGGNLYLTIDARLQRRAAESFPAFRKGAVVALDPRNGQVLVLFSNPSIDPNIFSMAGQERSKNWARIVFDTTLPLNNRATAGTYSPGSTFKLVTTIAGLEGGGFTEATHMPAPCRGAFHFGSRIAHCWELRGHGSLDLIGAVQQSCDIYFYQAGLLLGDRLINNYASLMGIGRISGIDIPGEKSGWLSGEDAYNERFKKKGWVWTKGLLLDLAIGQIQVVTPLQLALMVGGFGNSKNLYRPYLVKEERNPDGVVVKQNPPVTLGGPFNFKPESIAAIHKAMVAVIGPGGTGGLAAVPGIPVGGKSGSAQNPQGEKTHALFVACAPIDDPVIAVAVVVENAGHGGSIAAPIAGDVLRCFFSETEEGKLIAERYKADALAAKESGKKVEKPASVNGD